MSKADSIMNKLAQTADKPMVADIKGAYNASKKTVTDITKKEDEWKNLPTGRRGETEIDSTTKMLSAEDKKDSTEGFSKDITTHRKDVEDPKAVDNSARGHTINTNKGEWSSTGDSNKKDVSSYKRTDKDGNVLAEEHSYSGSGKETDGSDYSFDVRKDGDQHYIDTTKGGKTTSEKVDKTQYDKSIALGKENISKSIDKGSTHTPEGEVTAGPIKAFKSKKEMEDYVANLKKEGAVMQKLAKKYEKSGKPRKFKMTETQKDITAGLVAGAVSTFSTYPLDTVVTRKQIKGMKEFKVTRLERRKGSKKYTPIPPKKLTKIQHHMKKLKGLYKGVNLKMTKNVPGTAITLGTYAMTKRWLNEKF